MFFQSEILLGFHLAFSSGSHWPVARIRYVAFETQAMLVISTLGYGSSKLITKVTSYLFNIYYLSCGIRSRDSQFLYKFMYLITSSSEGNFSISQ